MRDMASPSTRVDDDLYADATVTGKLTSRSAAQQLSYWARIGRSVARSTTEAQLLEMLTKPYDELDTDQRAVVRAEWSEAIARRASRNYAAGFIAEGEPYAELDDDGNAVMRYPEATPRIVVPETVAAYFIAAYGREAVTAVTADRPLRRSIYDRWHAQHGEAPSSSAISNYFKKDWAKLPWKKLRQLAEVQTS